MRVEECPNIVALYYPNSQLFTRIKFRNLLTINEKRKPSSDFLFDLKAEEVHSVLNDMQIKKLEHRLSDIEIGHGIIRALSQKRHVTHPKIIKLQFPVRSMAMSLAVDPRYLVEAKKGLAQTLAARLGSHEIALEFLHAL